MITLQPLPQTGDALVEVRDLKKWFPLHRGLMSKVVGHVKAVDGVSLDILRGETLGLVGESGCGKTTVGRAILRLTEPTSGSIVFDNQDILRMSRGVMQKVRRDMQIVFQDPYASLNPRMNVGAIVAESLQIHRVMPKAKICGRVEELLEVVGLSAEHARRYPHEFSGGQRQRICIARALALNPKFLIFDEPLSALDVSIRSQILNLLTDLQDQFNLTYLFISHDLSVVEHVCDRVAVMYLGKIVEMAPKDIIFSNALHPYTEALLSAILVPNPKVRKQRLVLEGDVPSPLDPPIGCRFRLRCRLAEEICLTPPEMVDVGNCHLVACHLRAPAPGFSSKPFAKLCKIIPTLPNQLCGNLAGRAAN